MKISCQHKSIGKAQQKICHLSAWELQHSVLLMAVGLPKVVSRGLKRLRIVQNNVEDVPPPAILPPDEVPIPILVALAHRSESSDALSDGSTTDTVMFERDTEADAEDFSQSLVEEEVEFVVPRAGQV